MITTLISLFGLVLVLHFVKDILFTLWVLFIAKPLNLQSIYGSNSYAIITGGSKGIGLSIAKEFARRGFNLVLIARNQSDLQRAQTLLSKINPKIDILIRSFDFNILGKPNTEHDMWKLLDLSQDLDYSVLINNVGMANRDILMNTNEEEIKRLITVNCLSQTVMTHMMTKYFRKRGKLSCIFTTSSFSANTPIPAYELYGATKAFNKYYGLTLLDNPMIDSYVFCPAYVDTGLSRSKKNLFMISADESAEAAVKFIGRHRVLFYGHWKHELMTWGTSWMPKFLKLMIAQRTIKMKNQRSIIV